MGALIGGGAATILSLCILSRALGDNPLYRLAQTLLVGIALGYITAVLVRSWIVPPLEAMWFGRGTGEQWGVWIAGLVLGLLFITRGGRQRGSHWANYPLALLFGVGAALALVGAVRGTLVPQLLDTVRLPGAAGDLSTQIGAVVLALLTILTLLGFTYTSRQREGTRRLASFGWLGRSTRVVARGLILATFGVFFAATVTTYMAALVGQVGAISEWVSALWAALVGP